jgi:hypothetical protein
VFPRRGTWSCKSPGFMDILHHYQPQSRYLDVRASLQILLASFEAHVYTGLTTCDLHYLRSPSRCQEALLRVFLQYSALQFYWHISLAPLSTIAKTLPYIMQPLSLSASIELASRPSSISQPPGDYAHISPTRVDLHPPPQPLSSSSNNFFPLFLRGASGMNWEEFIERTSS